MASGTTRTNPNVSPSSPTSISDSKIPSPPTSYSIPQPDIFSNLTKSKLYELVPPPLKTVGLPPLFSIRNFRNSNDDRNNAVASNKEGASLIGSRIIDGNRSSLTTSLFPTFESFNFHIPDLNSILADRVEEWIAQHTRALILGVGLGAAVSVGVGVGLLAVGFPNWCGEIYKRGRRLIVWNYRLRLSGGHGDDVDASEMKGMQNGGFGEDEGTDVEISGRRRTGKACESLRADESSAAMAHTDVNRMGQSSSEEGSEVGTQKIGNYPNDCQSLAPRSTTIAILGAPESSSSLSTPSHRPKNRIIIIQGNPHHTSLQPQQTQHLDTIDKSIAQCQECLDSITATLGKHMLTWNSVGRISAHIVLGKCSGATFRSALSKYPVSTEDVIVAVYFVQCLEDAGACVQVEVLASG